MAPATPPNFQAMPKAEACHDPSCVPSVSIAACVVRRHPPPPRSQCILCSVDRTILFLFVAGSRCKGQRAQRDCSAAQGTPGTVSRDIPILDRFWFSSPDHRCEVVAKERPRLPPTPKTKSMPKAPKAHPDPNCVRSTYYTLCSVPSSGSL